MTTRFTGWHITAILVAFFGVVIAVNMWLAISARTTFGGALAENGYVASQDYNKWIAESAAQDKLGWTVEANADEGRLDVIVTGVADPRVTILLRHPLGRQPERLMTMRRVSHDRFVSIEPLPAGRWRAHIDVDKGKDHARFIKDILR